VREIRTLRAMWRGLETESRSELIGHVMPERVDTD